MDYGHKIRRLRRAKGWTRQKQLAEAAGLDTETISRAERSENLSIFSLAAIAAALDVSLNAFFETAPVLPTEEAALWHRLKDDERAAVRRMMRTLAAAPPTRDERTR